MRGRVTASMLTSEFEKFDEHAAGRSWVDERDEAVDTRPRGVIDEVDSLGRKAVERATEIAHLEAEVVHGLTSTLFDETSHAGFRVGRFNELDARVFARREDRFDALLGHHMLGSERVAEHVAIEGRRVAQRGYGDGDVMKAARVDAARHPRRGS